MIYVALLRGINVGGNNKIDMKELKLAFERVGMSYVQTYINSGNIIFVDEQHQESEIIAILEQAILETFKLTIRVMVRSYTEYHAMMQQIPLDWNHDKVTRVNVLFLHREIDSPQILQELIIQESIDVVNYFPGAVIWKTAIEDVTKSGAVKLIKNKVYGQITIRNMNTTRKIYRLMEELNEQLNIAR